MAVACGGEDAGTPGTDAGTDATTSDAGVQPDGQVTTDGGTGSDAATDGGAGTDGGELPPEVAAYAFDFEAGTRTPVELDLSCKGVRTAPDATGEATTFNLRMLDFQNSTPVEGLTVSVFPDNIVPSDFSCAGTCVEGTSNADGNLSVTDNLGSWYSYYVAPLAGEGASNTTIASIEYNVTASGEGSTHGGVRVSEATISLIPLVLGLSRPEHSAVIAGAFYDCNGNGLQNVQVRVYAHDGTFIADAGTRTGPSYNYFNGSMFPSSTATASAIDGLFAAINLPVSTETVRVESWGNVDGEMHMLGCEEGYILDNGITIMNLKPARADGPSGCSE